MTLLLNWFRPVQYWSAKLCKWVTLSTTIVGPSIEIDMGGRAQVPAAAQTNRTITAATAAINVDLRQIEINFSKRADKPVLNRILWVDFYWKNVIFIYMSYNVTTCTGTPGLHYLRLVSFMTHNICVWYPWYPIFMYPWYTIFMSGSRLWLTYSRSHAFKFIPLSNYRRNCSIVRLVTVTSPKSVTTTCLCPNTWPDNFLPNLNPISINGDLHAVTYR